MAAISPTEVRASGDRDVEKDIAKSEPVTEVLPDSKTESDSDSMQEGVKRVEAITTVWSKKSLWSTFALYVIPLLIPGRASTNTVGSLWLVCFVSALLASIDTALSPYVTSSFSKHGLLAVINIAARVIGGVVTLSIGKIIDIRGRMEGFVGALLLIVVGMVMKATAHDVETYAAAQVFTWVGKVALGFIIDVFVADITTLKNRMLIFALNSTPNLATTFAGPAIAQLFYERVNFRWAFGAFTIILVVVSLPVIAILYVHEKKAKALGVLRPKSGRTPLQSAVHYVGEFDRKSPSVTWKETFFFFGKRQKTIRKANSFFY